MKQAAEKGCTKRDWAPDDDLYEFALQALTLLDIANPPASPSITAPTPAARLIAELEDKKVYIKNIGEDDALNVTVEVDDDTAFRLNDTTWPVMSPGAKVFTALHSQALGRSNTGTFHLRWTDSNGQTREGRFPLG